MLLCWCAISGRSLWLSSCHEEHPSPSKETKLCSPTRHITKNNKYPAYWRRIPPYTMQNTQEVSGSEGTSHRGRGGRSIFPAESPNLSPEQRNALESSQGLLLANFTQMGHRQMPPQGSSVFPSAPVPCLQRSDEIFGCEWRTLLS